MGHSLVPRLYYCGGGTVCDLSVIHWLSGIMMVIFVFVEYFLCTKPHPELVTRLQLVVLFI